LKCSIHQNIELVEENRPLSADLGYCNLCEKFYNLQRGIVVSEYPHFDEDPLIEIKVFILTIIFTSINLGYILFASGLLIGLFGFPFVEIFNYKAPRDLNPANDYIMKKKFLQVNFRIFLYISTGIILFLPMLGFCTLLNILELFWFVYIFLLGALIIFRISEYKNLTL
jgi:hypothetical protein